jgi:hypothetical protein
MALPVSWPVVVALVVLTGWVVGLIILIALVDRLPRFKSAVAGSTAPWMSPFDRIAALAGARSAPLVSKILRYHVRSAARYNLVFAVPAVALMARHYEEALFAFALGVAPALGFVATSPICANLFGIDGPAVRRYFLLPVSGRQVFRATAFVSLALGAVVCVSSLVLWLTFSAGPRTGARIAMVTGAGVGGLLLFQALGLWTTVISPRTVPFGLAFGNRNAPAANVLMIAGVTVFFGLPMVLRQIDEQTLLGMWWAGPGFLGAGALFYAVTIRSAGRMFVTRRERLIDLLEEPV